MGIMSGVGGLVGGLAGLFGGGANNVQLPAMFQMPNMGAAAGNAFGGVQNLQGFTNTAQGTLGQAGQTFGNLYNNPYAGGFQQGAGVASGLGQNAALGAYGTGANLVGMGQSMIPGASAVLNTAFDPQSQLYNYMLGQTNQTSLANSAAAGLATTPYGVAAANQADQLFNMNWENQQLGRQVQGLGAFGTALGQSGALQGQGVNMMNAAPGAYLGASGMPYGTYAGIGQGQNQALQSYLGNITGAAGPQQQQLQDYLSYLGVGNQAQGYANQTAALGLQQQQQNFNQQMMMGGMLGGSLYGLGQNGFGMFGGPSSFGITNYGSPMYTAGTGLSGGDIAGAARAGVASGLTYNPFTGSVG